jgi:hypothetical protein
VVSGQPYKWSDEIFQLFIEPPLIFLNRYFTTIHFFSAKW